MTDKETFIKILTDNCQNRCDINNFINYLEKDTDFFYAPASTKFHLSEKGGLLKHSLNVYHTLSDMCMLYAPHISQDSIAICGLLHDICKTNFYTQELKYVKVNNQWTQQMQYVVNDTLPLGHGEKSVIILSQYFNLTVDEMIAIRWHMNGFDCAVKGGEMAYHKATTTSQLLTLLEISDLISSRLLEN